MPLLDSALYIFAAFMFGVIFGIFVKGLGRILLSIILAAIFLALLVMFFYGGRLSAITAGIIGSAALVFSFLIRRVNHTQKYDAKKVPK
jgi:hypothetical protein